MDRLSLISSSDFLNSVTAINECTLIYVLPTSNSLEAKESHTHRGMKLNKRNLHKPSPCLGLSALHENSILD